MFIRDRLLRDRRVHWVRQPFTGAGTPMTRPCGKTGMQVSLIGFGAAEIGFESTGEAAVQTILDEALESGVNVIDTAAMYADSEEKLGRALRNRRHKFFLFTKCGRLLPPRENWRGLLLRMDRKLRRFLGRPEKYESPYWNPRSLEWNIDQSLLRLGTDYIDLIQLHSCPEEVLRDGSVIEVLQRARQAGKVCHIGYSGDGAAALYAVRSGVFEVLQTSINIADHESLDLLVPLVRQHGIGLIAKHSIANGVWKSRQRPEDFYLAHYWDRLQQLAYEWLRGPRAFEFALRFTLSIPELSTALVGTTSPAHFRQNLEFARAGALDQAEFEAIRARWRSVAGPDWVGQM